MKLKILVGLLVFLIVVNLATIGSYIYFRMQDKHDWKRGSIDFPDDPRGRFSRPPHLDLTPDQRKQLIELRISFADETKELSQEIGKLREEIYQTLNKDTVSWTIIEDKLREIADHRMQIEKIAIQKLIDAKDYLSLPQRDHLFRFLLMEPSPLKGAPPFDRGPGFFHDRDRDQINRHNNKKKE